MAIPEPRSGVGGEVEVPSEEAEERVWKVGGEAEDVREGVGGGDSETARGCGWCYLCRRW